MCCHFISFNIRSLPIGNLLYYIMIGICWNAKFPDKTSVNFTQMVSHHFHMAVERRPKKALSPFNDKFYQLDSESARPLGHWRNSQCFTALVHALDPAGKPFQFIMMYLQGRGQTLSPRWRSFFRGWASLACSLPFSTSLCSFCTDNTAFNPLRKKCDDRHRVQTVQWSQLRFLLADSAEPAAVQLADAKPACLLLSCSRRFFIQLVLGLVQDVLP